MAVQLLHCMYCRRLYIWKFHQKSLNRENQVEDPEPYLLELGVLACSEIAPCNPNELDACGLREEGAREEGAATWERAVKNYSNCLDDNMLGAELI